jgi:NTP pyrophosphatase (non-canonical NTP hydrolase)
MTIKEAQLLVDRWISEKGVRYFSEISNALILMEEVGELSRLMVRHFGEQSFKDGEKPDNIYVSISDEIADILFVLICLSNQMGIDLDEALSQNIEKKTRRDSERHINNPKLID